MTKYILKRSFGNHRSNAILRVSEVWGEDFVFIPKNWRVGRKRFHYSSSMCILNKDVLEVMKSSHYDYPSIIKKMLHYVEETGTMDHAQSY